jgi:hypothetical protein
VRLFVCSVKSLRQTVLSGLPREARGRTLFISCVLLVVASGFCVPVSSIAISREATPADLIAEQLRGKETLQSASKSEFLGAVCAAVRKRRSAAAVITQAAVIARRESAGEIVGAVLRCAGKVNCESVGSIVQAAAAGQGDPVKVADAAIAKAPNCAETIHEAVRRGTKTIERAEPEPALEQGALSGTSNGADEGFDPNEPLELVCDGDIQRAVRASLVDEFIASHPAAFAGTCQPTVTPTATPTPTKVHQPVGPSR